MFCLRVWVLEFCDYIEKLKNRQGLKESMESNGGQSRLIIVIVVALLISIACTQMVLASDMTLLMNEEEIVSGTDKTLTLDVLSEKRKLFRQERTYGVSIDLSTKETVTIGNAMIYANDTIADPLVDFFVSLSGERLKPGKHIMQDIILSTDTDVASLPEITITLELTLCSDSSSGCDSKLYTIRLIPPAKPNSKKDRQERGLERRYSYQDIKASLEKNPRVLELEELVGFDFYHLLNDSEKRRLQQILSEKNESAYQAYLQEHFSLKPIKRTKKTVSLNDTESVLEGFSNETNRDVREAVESFKPLDKAMLSKEVLLYRLKNEETKKSDFVSKIILEYTTDKDMKGFSIVEKIPKELADDATLLRFNIEPDILERDPIVKWSFNEIPAGTTVDLTYAIPKRVGGVESDTFLYEDSQVFSDLKLFVFIGITVGLIVVISVWYKRKYIEQRPQKITIQTGKQMR